MPNGVEGVYPEQRLASLYQELVLAADYYHKGYEFDDKSAKFAEKSWWGLRTVRWFIRKYIYSWPTDWNVKKIEEIRCRILTAFHEELLKRDRTRPESYFTFFNQNNLPAIQHCINEILRINPDPDIIHMQPQDSSVRGSQDINIVKLHTWCKGWGKKTTEEAFTLVHTVLRVWTTHLMLSKSLQRADKRPTPLTAQTATQEIDLTDLVNQKEYDKCRKMAKICNLVNRSESGSEVELSVTNLRDLVALQRFSFPVPAWVAENFNKGQLKMYFNGEAVDLEKRAMPDLDSKIRFEELTVTEMAPPKSPPTLVESAHIQLIKNKATSDSGTSTPVGSMSPTPLRNVSHIAPTKNTKWLGYDLREVLYKWYKKTAPFHTGMNDTNETKTHELLEFVSCLKRVTEGDIYGFLQPAWDAYPELQASYPFTTYGSGRPEIKFLSTEYTCNLGREPVELKHLTDEQKKLKRGSWNIYTADNDKRLTVMAEVTVQPRCQTGEEFVLPVLKLPLRISYKKGAATATMQIAESSK